MFKSFVLFGGGREREISSICPGRGFSSGRFLGWRSGGSPGLPAGLCPWDGGETSLCCPQPCCRCSYGSLCPACPCCHRNRHRFPSKGRSVSCYHHCCFGCCCCCRRSCCNCLCPAAAVFGQSPLPSPSAAVAWDGERWRSPTLAAKGEGERRLASPAAEWW